MAVVSFETAQHTLDLPEYVGCPDLESCICTRATLATNHRVFWLLTPQVKLLQSASYGLHASVPMQVPACKSQPSKGVASARGIILRSSTLCHAVPQPGSVSRLAAPPMLSPLHRPGAAPHGLQSMQWQLQRGRSARGLTVARSNKVPAYMFQVDWTGDEQQLQSGRAEQVSPAQCAAASI